MKINDTRFWLGAIVLAIVASNALWIRLDTRPQPFNDPYVEKTFSFVDRVPDAGIRDLPELVKDLSVWPRPPWYQLAAVPAVLLFGRSPDAMLVVNLLALVVLAASTYKIAEMSMNGRAGWLAALIVSTYPPILNLAKIARPHAVVPAAVALSIALLLHVYRTRSTRHAWLFGVSLGGAVLVHPNTFYALPVPTVLVALHMALFPRPGLGPDPAPISVDGIRRRLLDPFVIKGILPAVAIAAAVAAVWYAPNLKSVAWLVKDSAENWSSAQYGFDHLAPSFWWYARTSSGTLSLFFTSLLVVSCAALVLLRSRIERPMVGIVALFGGCIYVGVSWRQGSSAWMNFALALPVAAALTGTGVSAMMEWLAPAGGHSRIRRAFSTALFVGCVGMALLNFAIVDWGVPERPSLWRRLGSPAGDTCGARMNVAFCPNPPEGGDWPTGRILRAVLEDPACERSECTLVVAANWRDAFSYSHLRYQLAQDFPGADMSIQRVVDYRPSIEWLTGEYVVYLRGWTGDPYQNAITSVLEAPPTRYRDLFEEAGLYPLPNGTTARLVRRTGAITPDDARTLVGLLDVPPELANELAAQVAALAEQRLGR